MYRKIGYILLIGALIAIAAEWLGIQLPTLRWPFNLGREISWLNYEFGDAGKKGHYIFPWFGYIFTIFVAGLGAFLLFSNPRGAVVSPVVLRRIQRFKAIRRGYISLWIILILALIAGLDHLLVGNKALAVKYNGEWTFPAFVKKDYNGGEFGEEGEAGATPADYRGLKKKFESSENVVIMPFVPYSPTKDTVKVPAVQLVEREGLIYEPNGKKLYDGLASTLYDPDNVSRYHIRYRFRKGLRDGNAEGKTKDKKVVYSALYDKGKLVKEDYKGEGSKEEFFAIIKGAPYEVLYFPARPEWSTGHLLGTNSSGNDLVAYLYGGLQVNFKAAIFYIPIVYCVGISVGLLMGYFGGKFDLIVQRFIEVLSNIPFLFVVIIVSAAVPPTFKGQWGIGVILLILAAFGWMGMTYLMRTAAYKEKARDYVAASKVLGASTPRIIFKHILPNTVAILVTLVPFSISGLIMSLTSLDYLGFGLPPEYATWGILLRDGLENLSSPWLVASSFFCLVSLLILVTFVGEAVREAFDPKKYTFYK